ncbi:hypothetical protein AB0G48_18165 [Streptomyces rubiginosohelvolus]|uniref:hypothetical protein n=1 Tax=Streptomyces rubiginosohelvolus TaxID=67362 RepID=UPI0033ED8570
MTVQPTPPLAGDPSVLRLRVEYTAALLNSTELDTWQVQIQAGDTCVGSLRAVRGLYGGPPERTDTWDECYLIPGVRRVASDEQEVSFEADEHLAGLRARFAARGGLCAMVAEQLLGPAEVGLREWGSRHVLVFEQLTLSAPFNDRATAACVISSVARRAADGDFLLVFPARTAGTDTGTALLESAGRMLWAEQHSEDLYCLDTKFDQGEGHADAWESLLSRVRH